MGNMIRLDVTVDNSHNGVIGSALPVAYWLTLRRYNMFAHIFKASARTGFKYSLLITPTASIAGCLTNAVHYMSKNEAKAAAKAAGATPHNY